MKMIVIAPAVGNDVSKLEACVDRILEGKKPSDLFWGFFKSTQPDTSGTVQGVMNVLAKRDSLFKEKIHDFEIDQLFVKQRKPIDALAKKIHVCRRLDHNAINLIVVGPTIVKRLVPALTWNKVHCVGPSKPLEGYIIRLNGYVCSFVC
jgi:hypothetical protein